MQKSIRILLGLAGLAILVSGCGERAYYVAGDEVKLKSATALGEIKADPRAYEGKVVMVEGTVSAVCQGAGCWAKVVTDDAADTLFVKSAGDKVILPKTCAGDRIRVEGAVVVVEAEPAEEGEGEDAGPGAEEDAEMQPCGMAGKEESCPKPDCFVSMDAVELYRS